MAERQLILYTAYSYTDAYLAASEEDRRSVREQIARESATVSQSTHLYTVFPSRPDADILIWSSWEAEEGCTTSKAFAKYAEVSEGWRRWLKPVQTLWGFTGISTYARGKSAQDIDPFELMRSPYFIVYPFSKTKEWYLMSADARQGQMNEHIKLGKQYPEILQLLVYSFGLEDYEFVVAYECQDLPQFSDLVRALRGTEARKHTLIDTPIITGIYRTAEEFVRS